VPTLLDGEAPEDADSEDIRFADVMDEVEELRREVEELRREAEELRREVEELRREVEGLVVSEGDEMRVVPFRLLGDVVSRLAVVRDVLVSFSLKDDMLLTREEVEEERVMVKLEEAVIRVEAFKLPNGVVG
jgi:SMC interacting uncharacterized protein involved in chromosome segregation